MESGSCKRPLQRERESAQSPTMHITEEEEEEEKEEEEEVMICARTHWISGHCSDIHLLSQLSGWLNVCSSVALTEALEDETVCLV